MHIPTKYIEKLHLAMDNVMEVNQEAEFTPGSRFQLIYNLLVEVTFNLSRLQTEETPYTNHYIDSIIAVDYFRHMKVGDESTAWVKNYNRLEAFNEELLEVLQAEAGVEVVS